MTPTHALPGFDWTNIICVKFPDKNCYEGVQFNVINIPRGWVGVNISERSVT